MLTRPEIKEITRTMIEVAGKDAITIAAAGDWKLDDVLEYAEFSENLGATALQAMKPAEAGDDEALDYFRGIASSTRMPLVLHGEFSEALLQRLVSIPSIVALKEDVGPAYFINVQRKFGDRLAIFEGGPEYIYLIGYPYGAPASYTTLGTFAPQITASFWEALAQDDLSEAYKIVMQYEHPFFDRWSHGFWRASLEHFGIAHRYLRPPQQTLTADEMQNVAKFYQKLGL
jgi:dihydrodipicolinate synthase/N-acetylneuraminate lyase